MLSEVTLARLDGQLDCLRSFIAQANVEQWERKPAPGKWSARENLAHLARYHEVFLDRVSRILQEQRPQFGRYRAEDDGQWPRWSSLDIESLLGRIRGLRTQLIHQVSVLSDEQLTRSATHPVLGEMNIPQWLEFFLLHEAHHLYTMLFRLREAPRT